MYQNFEGLEPGEDIENFKFFGVSSNPFGVLNQKNLLSRLIFQFEHLLHWSGTPYCLPILIVSTTGSVYGLLIIYNFENILT